MTVFIVRLTDKSIEHQRKVSNSNMATKPVQCILGDPAHLMTLKMVVDVARNPSNVTLATVSREKVERGRAFIESVAASDRAVYGVTTGFGELSRIRISPDQLASLQRNLIRSHAAGIGEPLAADVTRAMMLLLANSLSKGHSGVRPIVIDTILACLNHDIVPVIPSRGSVGASGDLAPLAHLALALIGESDVMVGGKRKPSREALQRIGMEPLTLQAKEGLALINGTHLMLAMGALTVHDGWVMTRTAEVAAAMSLEAMLGSQVPFDSRIHALRPQSGQKTTAARVLKLLGGSEIIPSHQDCGRVQDPYTLRCIPQVIGSVRDTLAHCEQIFTNELQAVTDNPLVFADDEAILTGGNFHGQPLATALDFAAISIAHLAAFSERRIYNLMGPHIWDVDGAPPFLTPDPGLRSGYMIAQYVAAALVNEINTLAHPASTGSIPTSAGMEDFVSMGVTSGHKVLRAQELARHVIAIELICAAQGLEFRMPLKPGDGVQMAYDAVRAIVPALDEDRTPQPDIEKIAQALKSGFFDKAVSAIETTQSKTRSLAQSV